MKTKKAIEILEQWIKDDKKILGDDTESDFAKFCIEKSEAIKTVLNRVKKPVTIADYIRSLDDELLGAFLCGLICTDEKQEKAFCDWLKKPWENFFKEIEKERIGIEDEKR